MAAVVFIQSNSAKREEHSGNYEVISTVNALKAVEIAVRSERKKAAELFMAGIEPYVGAELAPATMKMFMNTLKDLHDVAAIEPENDKQDEDI